MCWRTWTAISRSSRRAVSHRQPVYCRKSLIMSRRTQMMSREAWRQVIVGFCGHPGQHPQSSRARFIQESLRAIGNVLLEPFATIRTRRLAAESIRAAPCVCSLTRSIGTSSCCRRKSRRRMKSASKPAPSTSACRRTFRSTIRNSITTRRDRHPACSTSNPSSRGRPCLRAPPRSISWAPCPSRSTALRPTSRSLQRTKWDIGVTTRCRNTTPRRAGSSTVK